MAYTSDIAIGELTERVTIQSATSTTDGQGGRSQTWAAIASTPTVWAQVTPDRTVERLQMETIRASVNYRVLIRYRADVTPMMRLSWTPYRATTAKTLEIHGVSPYDGSREYLLLDCGEVI